MYFIFNVIIIFNTKLLFQKLHLIETPILQGRQFSYTHKPVFSLTGIIKLWSKVYLACRVQNFDRFGFVHWKKA